MQSLLISFVFELTTCPDKTVKELFPDLHLKTSLHFSQVDPQKKAQFQSVAFRGGRKPSHLSFHTIQSDKLQSLFVMAKSSHENGESVAVEQIQFRAGNPTVESTEGIIHLFKHIPKNISSQSVSDTVCIFNVACDLGLQGVFMFISGYRDDILHIRIVEKHRQGAKPANTFMVLLKFQSCEIAEKFYNEKIGCTFTSMNAEIAQLFFVESVEVISNNMLYTQSRKKSPRLTVDSWNRRSTSEPRPITVDLLGSMSENGGANGSSKPTSAECPSKWEPSSTSASSSHYVELPNCTVCLERMDEVVAGILTVLCNHSFHCVCLEKWQDSTCPVCRFACTPEEPLTCSKCDATVDLWICIICGNVGCGRYSGSHAHEHYRESRHAYSKHFDNDRVWDYVGDNYVHRIIQEKTEGKPIPFEGPERREESEEKLDSVTLEYTYLLTSQLKEQRTHFKNEISALEHTSALQLSAKDDLITKQQMELAAQQQVVASVRKELKEAIKSREAGDKRLKEMQSKLNAVEKDLSDERKLSGVLRGDAGKWKTTVEDLEKRLATTEKVWKTQVKDLEESVRDLMTHLEGAQKLQARSDLTAEELQSSDVGLESKPSDSRGRRSKRN